MSLDVNSYLNLFDAVVIIGVALPTLYISTRIKIRTAKVLFVLLSGFLTLHGIYHLTYFVGDYTGSDAIAFGDALIEPLSYVFLLGFVLYFAEGRIETTDITDLLTTGADWLSLLLIVASFLVISYLAYRVKTVRSFQFEMFVVLLVITLSEIPKILNDLGVINITDIETTGLIIHSAAMVFLSAFVALRALTYLRRKG